MKSHKYKIQRLIHEPLSLINYLAVKGLLSWLPDKHYLKLLFYVRMGQRLNLKNPKTFNEKLQWLKLYDRNSLYTKLVDKYEVRKYIERKIGKQFLIPLLGVYNSFDEIDFDSLPEQFVLKCTHDSGGIVICSDKKKFNIENARKKINKCLNRNFYKIHREWPYKDIEPKIICEKFMVDNRKNELIDFKFMCFNGEVKCIFVCSNRNSKQGLNIDIYDTNWNLMQVEREEHPSSGEKIEKPSNFDKMIECAKELSKEMPFIRVDFYEVNGRMYFGELTFYPSSGFEKFKPSSYDEIFGSWLKLPIKNSNI